MWSVVRLVTVASTAAVGLAIGPQAAPAAPAASDHQAVHAVADHGSARAPATDRAFLRSAHEGNLAEIASGRVALARSHSPQVRRIAADFIADHYRLDAHVRLVARHESVALPSTPSAAQRRDLAAVAALSGHRFDVAWLRMQVAMHRQTLALIGHESHHGRSPAVVALAVGAVPVVREHLTMALTALRHEHH